MTNSNINISQQTKAESLIKKKLPRENVGPSVIANGGERFYVISFILISIIKFKVCFKK